MGSALNPIPLHRVLAVLSAIGLKEKNCSHFQREVNRKMFELLSLEVCLVILTLHFASKIKRRKNK